MNTPRIPGTGSVGAQLMLAVFIPLGLAIVVGAAIAMQSSARRSQDRQRIETVSVVKALNEDFAGIVLLSATESAMQVHRRLAPITDIEQVCLHDLKGRRVFSYRRQGLVVDTMACAFGEVPGGADGRLEMVQGLSLEGRPYGRASVISDSQGVRDQLAQDRFTLLAMALFPLLFGALGWGFMRWRVSRPLDQLQAKLQTITSQEDFGVRVDRGAPGDVGRLQEGVNHMLARIEEVTQSLKEEELQLKSVLEATGDGFALFGRGGSLLFTNSSLREFLAGGDSGNKEAWTVARLDELLNMQGGLTQFVAQGRDGDSESFRRACRGPKAGLQLMVEAQIVNSTFAAQLVVVHVRDETAQKQAEVVQRQLWESNKMDALGRLAGGVAHDFNNLLTIMFAVSDELVATNDDPGVCEGIREIQQASERASEITRELLMFSRQGTATLRHVDLVESMRSAGRLVGRLLSDEVLLEVEVPKEPYYILAGPSHIGQIIMNLAINARDAMQDGGTIRLGMEVLDDRRVCLVVADSGSGMDADTVVRAMEPFFTTKTPDKGTGLGLAVVYGIVKALDGEIAIDSVPGRGTTFRVTLPLVSTACTGASSKPVALGIVRSRVMLVEDEPSVLNVVQRILRRRGYLVDAFAGPAEALTHLEMAEEPPELLVSDVSMPGMNGMELAEQIRRKIPAIRVLFMSGQLPVGLSEAMEGEVFLEKPFTSEALLRKLDQIVTSPRALKAKS